jgi:hypothetical protein
LPSTQVIQVYPRNSTSYFTQPHKATIHDDACNPSLEAGIPPKVLQVLESRDISHLHGILRFILGTQNTTGESKGRRIVTAEQLGHGRLISLFALRDQFNIFCIRHVVPSQSWCTALQLPIHS